MSGGFASRALLYKLEGNRIFCFDAGVALLVSMPFRMLALLYAPSECRRDASGLPVLEAAADPVELYDRLCNACREALEAYRKWRRGKGLLSRLFSLPSREELVSGEAYHALMVCREAGVGAKLAGFEAGYYIVYTPGSGSWKRLKALDRVEAGTLIERIEHLISASNGAVED